MRAADVRVLLLVNRNDIGPSLVTALNDSPLERRRTARGRDMTDPAPRSLPQTSRSRSGAWKQPVVAGVADPDRPFGLARRSAAVQRLPNFADGRWTHADWTQAVVRRDGFAIRE